MDKAAEVVSNMNTRVLKEPRGFIRIILVILAIFAFATTCSSSGYSSFTVTCPAAETTPVPTTKPQNVGYSVSYPFRLHDTVLDVNNCTSPIPSQIKVTLFGNFSAPSQFFVFVGVMAFLYSLAGMVLYVFFDGKYRQFDLIPVVDFGVTAVFAVLWLISSSAWAQGVADVKYYSSPTELISDDGLLSSVCRSGGTNNICAVVSHSPFAGLNVSLLFGFLNMGVWAASLWFLWKETRWFKEREAAKQEPTAGSPQQEPAPQQI